MANSRTANIIGSIAAFFILLVIVAVLFPVFNQRAHGPNNCFPNEEQIGLALLQYCQDYNEKFPTGVQKSGVGWVAAIQPYTKNTKLFQCQDDPTTADPPNMVDSYALNSNLVGKPADIGGLGVWARTVMVFEISGNTARLDLPDEGKSAGAKSFSAVGDGTDGSLVAGDSPTLRYATGYMGRRPIASPGSQFESAAGRHHDGANFLLGDGHVQWFLPAQVSTGGDAKKAKDNQTGGTTGRAAGTQNPAYAATFSTR